MSMHIDDIISEANRTMNLLYARGHTDFSDAVANTLPILHIVEDFLFEHDQINNEENATEELVRRLLRDYSL